ncbi:DUF1062 domain-containing protein [uncultured Clostridium sp.]|uniref:DUF1062 domain-containing protein n=1 Tax=uncultured Clostridium sp. TaxID=59620 RepID=UPI0025FA4F83|nr:DUF1062 domain-containing protein [uncultured Clostridium sp.]
MSCYVENKYEILPQKSYEIIRNCPKCGCKTDYINTNNFRINANGNLLDVWLIYQCEKCKHTYNLSIYERVKSTEIDDDKYKRFLNNDLELSFQYGIKKELFSINKAVVDEEKIRYRILFKEKQEKSSDSNFETNLIIANPYELKVRADKVLSDILNISRSEVKRMIKSKVIYSSNCEKLEKIHVGRLLDVRISQKNMPDK